MEQWVVVSSSLVTSDWLTGGIQLPSVPVAVEDMSIEFSLNKTCHCE